MSGWTGMLELMGICGVLAFLGQVFFFTFIEPPPKRPRKRGSR